MSKSAKGQDRGWHTGPWGLVVRFSLMVIPCLFVAWVLQTGSQHAREAHPAHGCYWPAVVASGGHLWTGDGGPLVSPAHSPVPLAGWFEYTCKNGKWAEGNG